MLHPSVGPEVLFGMDSEQDGCHIALHGELDLATAPLLLNAELQAANCPDAVTIDLSRLTFLDSAGLGALLELCSALRKSGAEVQVIRPTQGADRIIALTGAGGMLDRVSTS